MSFKLKLTFELKCCKYNQLYLISVKNKQGEEYMFRQDWGEQLAGKYSSVIAVYDLDQDIVNILEGVPEDLCPGQVIWSPDGASIVGVALQTQPRKLGLIYCTNRYGAIFQLDFNGVYRMFIPINYIYILKCFNCCNV